MHVNINCMVMTRALVNFSPWLRICSWLELRGKWMVSYVPQVREEQMVSKDLSLCACVCGSAPDCGCMVDGSNAVVAS